MGRTSRRSKDRRLTRLEEETAFRLREMRKAQAPRRRTRGRWDPKETAHRILSTIDDLDRALHHADQLFSTRDPEMAQDVKQEIRELFRQMWRQQMNGQEPGIEDDDWEEEGGVGDEAGYADVEPDDWQR